MGRRPVLKGEYDALAEGLGKLGLRPPPFKAFRQTPPSVRRLLGKVLERRDPEARLPDRFRIVGEWVSCVVMADGKTVLVSGRGLRLQAEGQP